MLNNQHVIVRCQASNPERRGETGGRLEWLTGGHTLDEFLDNFPSVTREQAVAFLEQAAEALTSKVFSGE